MHNAHPCLTSLPYCVLMCFFLNQVTPSTPDAPPVAASSELAEALVMKELQEKTE